VLGYLAANPRLSVCAGERAIPSIVTSRKSVDIDDVSNDSDEEDWNQVHHNP
jgi:hypothetical protein